MKRTALAVLIIASVAILYSSCYKTGEVIYQTECKPDSLAVSIPMYNFIKFFTTSPFYGSLNYDANRRLKGATTIKGGLPVEQYDFMYDGNNNLIQINGSEYFQNALSLNLYITFSYPAGTSVSLSSTAQVQLHLLGPEDNVWAAGPVWTYNFNSEFQLVSIFQGTQMIEQLTYDNGGDCLADSIYFGANNTLNGYFTYPAYDNKINPARSDRSIQLFLQMYSKNNPTISNQYFLDAATNAFELSNSSSGSYTYNADGYPLTYAGNLFADYNCVPVPNPVSAPGPVVGK